MKLLVMMDATRVTGPAKQLLATLPRLAQAGVDCELLVALRRGVESTPYWEAASSLRLPIHRIEDRFPGDPRLLQQFRAVVKAVHPDIIQTHGYRPNAIARLSKGAVPWLGFWHGATWENWKVRAYNRIDLWALAKADRVVTVSQKQADTLRQALPAGTRIEVIPNAVVIEPASLNAEERRLLRTPYTSNDRTKLIGVFGRFSAEKGQDLFLQSLSRLRSTVETGSTSGQDSSVHALLLGEGPEEESLRRLTSELGLESRVHFLGYQADIARYYALIDLLVLPSRSEGLPNVILEAMTCGVPVVATAVGGVPEVVRQEKNGLLVTPEDPVSLAQAIDRVLSDDVLSRRLAAAGQSFVAAAYSLDARVHSLLRLYESVLRSSH